MILLVKENHRSITDNGRCCSGSTRTIKTHLLCGPPGLGKTTLAHIVGNELEREVRVTSGPVIDKPGDLAGLLTNLQEGGVLFIDEIHRIPKTVEKSIYTRQWKDYRIDIMIDQGPNARYSAWKSPASLLLERLLE